MVDAPVSGGAVGAQAATLTFMVRTQSPLLYDGVAHGAVIDWSLHMLARRCACHARGKCPLGAAQRPICW